jgi:hypothetical protein
MARELFLVYEIDPRSQPAAGGAGNPRIPSFTPTPRGAYFARGTRSACRQAAMHLGRAGTFAAVRAKARKIEFSAAELSNKDIKRLMKQAQKQARPRR